MQIKNKNLYKEILKINPELESEEIIEQMLLIVTQSIKEWARDPDKIILNVKHFGKFYYRLKKTENALKREEIFAASEGITNQDEHKRFIGVIKRVINLYKPFSEKKQEIRKIRFAENYITPEQLKESKIKNESSKIKINGDNKYGYKVLV